MRQLFALFCALSLPASLFFLAYVEAERLLGCADTVYPRFDAWLPLVIIIASSFVPFVLPWVIGSFSDVDSQSSRERTLR